MADVIVGPADPDLFRVNVGRQRWYIDPLPACDIAPEDDPDKSYPSISRVKKADAKDWTWVAYRRIAQGSVSDFEKIAAMAPSERVKAFATMNDLGLKIDSGRGTIIHWWGEDLLNGKEPRDIDMMTCAEHDIHPAAVEIAERYKPALIDFFEAYQPRLIATEFVVVHRDLNGGVGYGGTGDGLWYLDSPPRGKSAGPYAFDYKSRGPTSKHGAYPDEAAQIAAGARAQYMIVSGPDGEPVRAEIPEVVGGMVVSIKPDGARIYPVDIDEAWRDFTELHGRFVQSLRKTTSIGRVWPVKRSQ